MSTATSPSVRFPIGSEIPAPPRMRYLDVGEIVPKGAQFFSRTSQKWELSQLPYSYSNPECKFENQYIVPSHHPRHA